MMEEISLKDILSVEINDTVTPMEVLQAATDDNMKWRMEIFFTKLQAFFIKTLMKYEEKKEFLTDHWQRDGGGGGITCVLQNGTFIEKVGINISSLQGTVKEQFAQMLRNRGKNIHAGDQVEYFVTGISVMLHPTNPFLPSLHFNYRYFEVDDNVGTGHWWFGGCCDLFPNYVNREDFQLYHKRHKDICDQFGESYAKFLSAANDYNFNSHRGEHTGIGGIFFDDFCHKDISVCYDFVTKLACTTLPVYLIMFEKHMHDEYTDYQRKWQLVRRGRYVEFNLTYGRGTKFGLHTPGIRVESVLMPLPPQACWVYNFDVEPGSLEEELVRILQVPQNWINETS